MTEPTFGIVINRSSDEPRPIVPSDLSVLGFALPSDDADDDVFPLQGLVEFNSNDNTYLTALGTGPLAKAVQAVNTQLADFQVAARVVAVRVPEGDTIDDTIANIIGSQAAGTGLYALLRAGQLLGVIPRIIGAPGYTGRFTRAAGTKAVTSAVKAGGNTGTGGLTLANPAYGADMKAGIYRVRCKTVEADGGVFSVTDPDGVALADATAGVAYNGTHVKFTIADGNTDFAVGDGFDLTGVVTLGAAEANPICAVLPAIASALLAHAVVGGPGTNKRDALDWRETINSDRLICVDNYVRVKDGLQTVEEDAAARVMGIGVSVDFEHGGVPSHSWANRPIQGIIGLRRYDAFSLTDGATDAQELLAGNVGVVVRGELGVETAIAQSGYVFIGTDNAGDDPLWQFYNVTRMRDYIHLALLKSLRKRLGVSNITPHSVQALENDMSFFLADLKADEHILGFRVGFEKDKNSPEQLRLGHLRVFFQAEEPPVLRKLTIDSRRYRPALEEMLDTLIAQANTLVA